MFSGLLQKRWEPCSRNGSKTQRARQNPAGRTDLEVKFNNQEEFNPYPGQNHPHKTCRMIRFL